MFNTLQCKSIRYIASGTCTADLQQPGHQLRRSPEKDSKSVRKQEVILMDITGIISVVSSFAATFGGILVSSKLTTYRIEQLEKKIEKLADISERVSLIEERFKIVNERIDRIETTINKE